MAKTHFLLGNLGISESFLGIQEKIQCRSALPHTIVQYYFCDKCVDYLFMLPKNVYRPPLYDLLDKAEVGASRFMFSVPS